MVSQWGHERGETLRTCYSNRHAAVQEDAVCISVYESVRLYVSVSLCLDACLSVCLHAYMYIGRSVWSVWCGLVRSGRSVWSVWPASSCLVLSGLVWSVCL